MANEPRLLWLLALLSIAGCAALSLNELEERYGTSDPRNREVAQIGAAQVDYWHDVAPVIEKRCVACHACYDAPCQLKLSSIEGIERGGTPAVVYQQSRLQMAPTTRLFQDAQSVSEWRGKGFHPVLNEFDDTPEANREAGVMYRLLTLKGAHPQMGTRLLPEEFTLTLDRKEFCAKPETLDEYERTHPDWGMPYALPGLENDELGVLLKWLEQGATYTPRPPLAASFVNEIARWEAFLNGDSLKAQLSGRYIYEHLFLAHLFFPEVDNRTFFRLVRSATPPGQPIEVIATRRPYNDPGVDRVYYRLQRELASVVVKTHMPYALNSDLLTRWREWFHDQNFEVTVLPSYEDQSASNPYLTFAQLPTESRYRFLLERAQFTIMSFIKGPVCRGQVALNVINDNFWVFFLNPNMQKIEHIEEFSALHEAGLQLPASTESIYRPITHWRRYARQQKERLAALDSYLTETFEDPDDMSLEMIWDGDGVNDNAALTVLRHFDSATVAKGLIGKPPKTAWIVGYSLLERIHYLLVAGYDVYGNVGHQLLTRIYMDFLRMEGETAFLLLLPQEARDRERRYWYRQAEKDIDDFMTLPQFEHSMTLAIDYSSDDEKLELYGMLRERLAGVLPERYDLSSIEDSLAREQFAALEFLKGPAVLLMPQVVFVEVMNPEGSSYVTIVRNDAHLNITSMLGEKKFREPAEDTLTVVAGFLGAYPNALFRVGSDQLEMFISSLSAMNDEDDYGALLDAYGIRRTNAKFWDHSDSLHSAFRKDAPIEYGQFDYSRLENR